MRPGNLFGFEHYDFDQFRAIKIQRQLEKKRNISLGMFFSYDI